ncbi:TPA: formylglycine-generating enzyme family protein [Escherichia coli]|uniref:formylglycine-generating enzyme family protein n=1 Tax=Escherichia coli TaxID=562 RepID=UPI000B7F92BF|nr:SUMF1/EgtB/PvdO family nonheme iron enzyme [Escherichia coli]EHT1099473.1 SUMF1/EgtB/PvdO family nonheme iron enzyme [Escherichia coli]EKK4596437.1 SUMF1/EgtB/PvdO family nonheme iron enzyme [Escherichia coli]KAE9686811.1 SUMF1/EgtB/PvdO family nonheme iron enzyme [Escherichia coli]MBB7985400.1 SUMF1/EgtB/PvdO family nonheme iron enzyme [Escherichia coli]MWQ96510.1 SUMF1/EgtB/PvdO family nonheme iron enzyme [Escherichia coli]
MERRNLRKTLLILVFAIVACDSSSKNTELANKLVDKSVANMVSVKGGDFLMGDFGPLVGEKIPFSIQQDDKVLHKVTLSSFMISKYKVTNADYKTYLDVTGKDSPPTDILAKGSPTLLSDNYSARITWQRAKGYCLWLGEQSGKKVDLPTEAQWEYAARSEGKYLPFATDNGKIERGKNYPTDNDLSKYTDGLGLPIYPIGKYPPNPLGLYDMGLSGKEWTNDWYTSDYYSHSPMKDPQGPAKGERKVQRGAVGGDDQYALTIFRQSSPPDPKPGDDDYNYAIGVFRCVINK